MIRELGVWAEYSYDTTCVENLLVASSPGHSQYNVSTNFNMKQLGNACVLLPIANLKIHTPFHYSSLHSIPIPPITFKVNNQL